MRKFLLLISVSILAICHKSGAQCFPEQLYDKIISGYHGSIALLHDGSYQCWGEDLDSTGSGNQGTPVSINVAHYPRLTGTALKAAVGGRGSTKDQYFLLTTTHLFAWGPTGNVLNSALTPSNTFQKVTSASFTNADSTGLPAIGGPSHVTMLFATYQTLTIVTDSGFVYVITQADANLQGDGSGSITSTTWHKVKINSSTYLTGVTSIRGEVTGTGNGALMATTTSGNVYVWGPSVYMGDGTYATAKNYATQMTLPSEFNSTNKPYMIGVTGGTSTTYTSGGGAIAPSTKDTNSFYVLSASGTLYSLGYNADKQLGDFTTVTRTTWVHAKKTATQNFTDVNYFSVQEADNTFPAVAVVSDSANILFCWGYSSYNMLGTSVDSSTNPHVAEGFAPGGDIALFPEMGGHTLVYLKAGSSQFCYIGHKINGSMGDGVITGASVPTFDCSGTPTVWVCGSVPVAGNDTNSVISASPNNIIADGLATTTITLQLKTSNSQGDTNLTTTGGLVTMSATHGTLGAVTDHNNGTYTATLTSSVTATPAIISFTLVGATDVLNTCTVNFTPDEIYGPSSVLVGYTINLTDTTVGGTWTSSNTSHATVGSSTGIVTGTGSGVATITYTAGGYYATYPVTVSMAAITGPNTDTAGQTITLADICPGGTWSSSNTGVATMGSAGIMTGVAAGTATITYTIGVGYVVYPVTVNAMLPITGPSSVYVGNAISLANASPGGTWSSSNTGIATIGTSGIVTGVTIGDVTITYTKGSAYVTHDVTINPISAITGASIVYVNNNVSLSDVTPGGTWSSSNSAIASIGTSGTLTGVNVGVVTITYTLGGAYVTYTETVSIAPITGPSSDTAGQTISLADASAGGTWSSSNTSVASIGTSGVMTGVAAGNATITYTLGGNYVIYPVTVNAMLPITGPSSVYVGNAITLADASTGGTWSSSNTGVATINSYGVLTGVTTGGVTITYTKGGAYVTYDVTINPISPITGATSLYVNNSIALADFTPGGTWSSSNTGIASIGTSGSVSGVNVGNVTITYTLGGAFVTYTETVSIAPITGPSTDTAGQTISLADASPGGTWSSSNTAIANIGTAGVMTGVAAGNVTITYTIGGNYVTYPVTVNAMLPITGPSSVYVGNSITLVDASVGGTWSSSNTGVATIDPSGTVTGVTTGSVTITYTRGSAYVTYGVTINPISPITGATSVYIGNSITLADITPGGTWSSNNTGIAAVGTNGVVSGVALGSTTITYTLGGAYVIYAITVNALPPLTGPTGVYITNTITLTDAAAGGTWSSSNTGIAGIGTSGIVTGIAIGTATITYTLGGAYVTYNITVNPLAPITGPASVLIGSTITLADLTTGGSWSSSNTSLATVGTSGIVTGAGVGSVTITYSITGNFVTYSVTVNTSSFSGIPAVCQGANTTLGYTPGGGTWASANSGIATIGSSSGILTGVASGTVIISYTYSGSTYTETITVNPLPTVQSITGSGGLCVGNTTTLSTASTGGAWSSGSSIVTVGTGGVVTGFGMGTANISYSVTDINGCTGSSIKSITVAGLPNYLYTGAGTGANTATGDGGPAYLATLMGPRALCSDTAGNVYIADVMTNTVRKIGTNGYISTVAGNGATGNAGDGGQATAAQLNMSGGGGLYVDKAGNMFICNTTGMTIRKVTASTGIISTICGTTVGGSTGDGGPATAAKVQGPLGICKDTTGNIYFADGGNAKIRRISAGTGIISTIIGTGSGAYSGDGGLGIAARVYLPRDVIADNYGNLYIADYGNNVIRKYVIATGIITTIAGTGVAGNSGDGGPATAAQLYYPARLAFDGSNNLFIADQFNNRVRKVNLSTGIISSSIATGTSGFSGDGGPSVLGKLTQTAGIAITRNGNIYVSDITNRRVRVSPFNGSIYITLAGASTITYGSSVTLTANPSIVSSDASLQWYKNNSAIGSGANTLTDVPTASGTTYYCVLTIAPECGATFYDTSNIITITIPGHKAADSSANIINLSVVSEGITIFPNPVHGQLNITVTGVENGTMQVNVYDQLGRIVVAKNTVVTENQVSELVDMQSLSGGMYIISVTDAVGKSKFVKCMKN